jgi:TetR/AcrR family transcriptional regulator, ethionamide resistance regulator
VEATTKRAAIQASVLEATEGLLREGASFADLNVERIARAAGISRTAFYFYFSDKRELLMKLSEDVTNDLYEQADIWWSGDGDPVDDIREAITRVATLYWEHAPLLRAIVEVSTYDEEVAGFWRGLVARFADATERRILDEQAAGNAPEMPAKAVAFSLTWMAERVLYQQLVQEQPHAPEDVVAAMVGIYVRSVYGRVA